VEALKNPRCKAAYDDVVANGMMAGMKYIGERASDFRRPLPPLEECVFMACLTGRGAWCLGTITVPRRPRLRSRHPGGSVPPVVSVPPGSDVCSLRRSPCTHCVCRL
jgi:hypothetical protein